MRTLDEVTGTIIESAVKIHRTLGPGLLESVYETVLARDLERRGFAILRQRPVSFEYDGMKFRRGFQYDLLVEGCVLLEIKSLERLAPVHGKQLLTYLRLMNLHLGLLLNFGETTMKEGIHRVVNNLPPSASPALRVNAASSRGGAETAEKNDNRR